MRKHWFKHQLALPGLALLGVAIFVVMVRLAPAPQHQPHPRIPPKAGFITLSQQRVAPRALAYGVAEPAIALQETAEVSGRVMMRHPDLNEGALLPAGTEVMRLDDRDYQLALDLAKAELAGVDASLSEQDQQERNLTQTLTVIDRKLKIAKRELTRLQTLREKGSVSQSSVEAQATQVLALQQEQLATTNSLRLLPSQRQSLQSQRAAAQAQVALQQHNIERTHITLPFAARISEVPVQQTQFVTAGTPLFTAQSLERFEVRAQISPEVFVHFTRPAKGFAPLRPDTFDAGLLHDLLSQLDLSAHLRLVGGTPAMQWQGRIDRISQTLDPQTRTLGLIVSIDHPYEQMQPGERPPVLEGMYMEVELRGKPQPLWVIPRDAALDNRLRLLDADNRLETRPLPAHWVAGDMFLVQQGLQPGQRVITSELFPAIEGMALTPDPDTRAQERIDAFISGEEALQ